MLKEYNVRVQLSNRTASLVVNSCYIDTCSNKLAAK